MNIEKANYPFNKGLSKVIKEKGLKQTYVAEKAGYTKNELCDMLKGRRLIKACDILKLSIVLGVTADDIYKAGEADGTAANEQGYPTRGNRIAPY